jgi:uncharacterized membrane protein YhaH (DUF805 family)
MRSSNPYAAPVNDFAWEIAEGADRDNWLEKSFLWLMFSLRGRLPRLGYWAATLVIAIAYGTTIFVSTKFIQSRDVQSVVLLTVMLPLWWSTFAISAKRWHDRDKSAWWILISFIPLIGPLWAFIEQGFLRGTYGPNNYGRET